MLRNNLKKNTTKKSFMVMAYFIGYRGSSQCNKNDKLGRNKIILDHITREFDFQFNRVQNFDYTERSLFSVIADGKWNSVKDSARLCCF